MSLLDEKGEIKLEFPGLPQSDIERIRWAIIDLVDTKFFNLDCGEVRLFIQDGFVHRIRKEEEGKSKRLKKKKGVL